jgi:signal transduction histidine kinase
MKSGARCLSPITVPLDHKGISVHLTKSFTLEPLDLNDATREVIALSANDLHRNRIVLRSELPDDLPDITGDRIQLQQVILNLVRNASEAMADRQGMENENVAPRPSSFGSAPDVSQ